MAFKIIRLCQELILMAHNIRSKYKRVKNGPTQHKFGFKTKKTGVRGQDRLRGEHRAPKGNKNTLFSYFASNSNNQAAQNENDIVALSVQPGDKKRLAKNGYNTGYGEECPDQLMAMCVGGHIKLVLSAKCYDWGKQLWSRQCFMRLSEHDSQNKHVLLSAKDTKILKTIKVMQMCDLQPEAVTDFLNYAPVVVGKVPENKWEAKLPILLIFSDYSERLQAHMLSNSEQMVHLHITEDEDGCFSTTERHYMNDLDWDRFEAAEIRRMTRPCENLQHWACHALRKGSWTITNCTDNNTLKDATWAAMTRMLERTSPGIMNQLASESGLDLSTHYSADLSAIEGESWKLTEEPMATLSQMVAKGNLKIRYNGESAKYVPRAWFPDKYSLEVREGGPLAMLKDMCADYVDTCNMLKTELTTVNRTAETVIKRNMTLHTENKQLHKRVQGLMRQMAEMTVGLMVPGEKEVPDMITPRPRDPSPYVNQWTTNADGSVDNVAYMEEKRKKNAACEPFLQGSKVREVKSPRTLQLELRAERRCATIRARGMCEDYQLRYGASNSSTPAGRSDRSRSTSGDSRRYSSASGSGTPSPRAGQDLL